MADTFKDQFNARKASTAGDINSVYDSTLDTHKQGLQDAYNKNMGVQDQFTADTKKAYSDAMYDWNVQEARNRRNMDTFADVRNLNRQEGSQQSLQLNSMRNAGIGKLGFQRQQAVDEANRQIELTKTNYQSQVAQAIADNDYKRAAALLDDYNNQETWLQNNAQILASYGNFSGFSQMYGDDTANGMREYWIASNPDLAYNTGMIDSARYKAITGYDSPAARAKAGYGYGGYGWGGGGGGSTPATETTDPVTKKSTEWLYPSQTLHAAIIKGGQEWAASPAGQASIAKYANKYNQGAGVSAAAKNTAGPRSEAALGPKLNLNQTAVDMYGRK